MKRLRSDLGRWKSRAEKRSKGQRKDAGAWTERLDALRHTRAPFDGCAREIVRSVLGEHLPDEGRLVEVGAGAGQLRHWLSDGVRERFIHTDTNTAVLAKLASDFPEAETRRSSVETLPFGAGEISGVAGLCVLDMMTDLRPVMSEMRRVLRPGGRLIHFLDMAPTHDVELAELARDGKLALPNLFGEPLESTWPLDLLVTDQVPMRRLLEALRAARHPLPEVFGRYFAAAMADPFDTERASREFYAISRAPKMRELLKSMLHSAYAIGWKLRLEPPVGTLLSSGKQLSERLDRSATSAGLEVVMNDVVTSWLHQPTSDPELRLRSLALGQGRLAADPAERLLCKEAPPPPPGHELVELGVFVFVARAPS